jgi:hypothetical protein
VQEASTVQNTTGVAVLATHLAVADRRALSQAWYSALHLAERTPARPSASRAGRSGAHEDRTHVTRAPHAATARDGSYRGPSPTSSRTARARHDDAALAAERRAPKTVLARRIERALARCVPSGASCSVAVNAAGGRVRLLVRSDATGTRIVAVCSGALRERVERALAQARFALAECGVRAEVA